MDLQAVRCVRLANLAGGWRRHCNLFAETAIVVCNRQPEQTIARTTRRLLQLFKFDWHTSPIIQNFQDFEFIVIKITTPKVVQKKSQLEKSREIA